MTLPAWQQEIIQHAELYRVGGAVRDGLLGIPHNVDIDYLVRGIEPLRLEEILSRHGKVTLAGKVFGVYHFAPADGADCDIAFPRVERSTGPGHRDFAIETDWTLPVEDDLRRRDFTINAMAERIPDGTRIDPFDGEKDLAGHRLRMIFPEAFVEDPLRILRGARFTARFELGADAETADRMREAAPLLDTVSPERVQDEFTKILTQCDHPSASFEMLRQCGGLAVVFPELDRCAGVTQNEYHPDDVYWHSLKVCDAAPRGSLVARWSALLHDLGKVDTRQTLQEAGNSRVVFYGHESVSAEIATRVLERLRYPRTFVQRCTHLVREHMFRYDSAWKAATLRRFIARVGPGYLDDLFVLREADCRSRNLVGELEALAELRVRVAAEMRERNTLHVTDLAVAGEDVMRVLGVGPGKRVGQVLDGLLDRVLEHPEMNRREVLLRIMDEEFSEENENGRE